MRTAFSRRADNLLTPQFCTAGIAGLAAATALRHHNVTVLEQSRLKEEVGAAIHLGPNAAKIALGWGMSLDNLNSPETQWVSSATFLGFVPTRLCCKLAM